MTICKLFIHPVFSIKIFPSNIWKVSICQNIPHQSFVLCGSPSYIIWRTSLDGYHVKHVPVKFFCDMICIFLIHMHTSICQDSELISEHCFLFPQSLFLFINVFLCGHLTFYSHSFSRKLYQCIQSKIIARRSVSSQD